MGPLHVLPQPDEDPNSGDSRPGEAQQEPQFP